MKRLKKSVSILLTLAMMFGILAIIPLEVNAANGVSYIYRSWDGKKVVQEERFCKNADYTLLASRTSDTLSSGWYVVDRDMTINNRIRVSGTVNLILCDDKTLTMKAGISVLGNDTLHIFGQSKGTGKIYAHPKEDDDYSWENSAVIGGTEDDPNAGNIIIDGGTLDLKTPSDSELFWDSKAACLGGGYKGTVKSVQIFGGDIKCKSDCGGAAIGGGIYGAPSNGDGLLIYGGKIDAQSSIVGNDGGAAIGGGYDSPHASGTIRIYGGEIKARASTGAAIGSGDKTDSCVIIISGGCITATATTASGYSGAAIGSGRNGRAHPITISDAAVIAVSASGAAIGSGEDGPANSIHISRSFVCAESMHGGAGIGSGYHGDSNEIVIEDSVIFASSKDFKNTQGLVDALNTMAGASIVPPGLPFTSQDEFSSAVSNIQNYIKVVAGLIYFCTPNHSGAGIGGGVGGNADSIRITGSYVKATAEDYSAAVGSGEDKNFGKIEIINSEIEAESGDFGAAIGSGDEAKKCGTITITGSTVTASAGSDAAGIGTGNETAQSATINITDSTVTAHGGRYGAGIGGGDNVSGGTINITNSTIKEADSKTDGAGIGGGESGHGGTITITNSNVTAHGGGYAAGIGGGDSGDGGTITIDHSTVKAYGGTDAAGIGGGEDGDGGHIEIINYSNVYARGKDYGAGIGGGEDSSGEYCQINNTCTVEAVSGGGGNVQSIGHGDCGWYVESYTGGTLSLGISEKVKVGSVSYTGNNRFDAIRNNTVVTVYPCDHTETEWRCENAGYHIKYCTNCGYRFGTAYEAHDWDSNNICKVCGASAKSATITIVERNNNGEIRTEMKVPQYINTTLPECKNVPDGMEFAYWIVDSNYFSVPGGEIHYVGNTMLTAVYLPVVKAAFIDADGIEKTETARKITQENLQYNDILLTSGWYYIESDIATTKTIYIHGHVNLIIADGKTLKFDNYEPSAFEIHPHYPSSTLSIYGQSEQSGTLNCYARPDVFYNLKQYGCIVKIPYYADCKNALTIASGSFINETCVQAPQGVTISGGTVKLEEIKDSGDIQLGWKTLSDSIQINSITESGTVRIAENQKLQDENGNIYEGKLTSRQVDSIEGKLLTPYLKHTYGEPVWNWMNNYKDATATFKCTDIGCNYEQVINVKGTYEDSGNNRTVTAVCNVLGQEYKTTQTFRIIFDVAVKSAEHGTVTVNKKSAVIGDNIKLEVTPDENYILSELYYTDSKGKNTVIEGSRFTMPESSVTITAVFAYDMSEHTHTYSSEPVWKWSSDYTSAQMIFPCTVEECDDGIAYDATVVTYSQGEKLIYMAMVYVDGKFYSTSCTVDHIHTYGEPEWQWSDDFSSAKAFFYCQKSNCGNFEVSNATVTAKSENGKLTFTAAAQFGGKTYTDKKELSCQYFARKEPYIDDKGEYIIGNVEYYVIDGKNYSVDLNKSVVRETDNVSLSYFDFMLWGSTYVVSHYTGSYDLLQNDELVIPKSFNGKKITRIGPYDSYNHDVFMHASGTIKPFTLVLNENITDIGTYAFTDTTVTKVIGDTSSLRYIGWKAFAWDLESPKSMSLDIQLDYSGTIDTDRFAFEHRDVTIRMKHSATITKDREWGWWEKSEKYIFTDAHTYSEPVWDWDEDYIGATVTRTCTHPNCKHTESVLAEFVMTTDEDGIPYEEAVAKFGDAVYHDVQPVYKTEAGGYIVEITGRFKGGVDSGKHNLADTEGFRVVFKDKNGNKVTPPQYIWTAQESVADGISVEPNGDVSFTQEGDFHVQLRSPDGKTIYSAWIPVRAYRGGDDGLDNPVDDSSYAVIPTKTDMPQTGDFSSISAVAGLLLASLTAVLFVAMKRRKKRVIVH